MAHQWLRCNLLSSYFPLLTDLFGESVLIKGLDQATPYSVNAQNDAEIFYCENVMPTTAGYGAAGIVNENPNGGASALGHGQVNQAYNLSYADSASGGVLLRNYMATSIGDSTGFYVYDPFTDLWHFLVMPGAPSVPPGAMQLSTATVAGQTYICSFNQGIYHYRRSAGPALLADTVTGITATQINGICGSNGLMIAWTASGVFWSSDSNPLDFTPSLVTGSGGGNIGEVKGAIVYCAAVAGGFIIYATDNIVQANYTGNVAYPFKFQEIAGSGGTQSQALIAYHDNSDTQFAWTDKGLQSLQVGQVASDILDNITEFLTAGYYETFDPVGGQFFKVSSPIDQLYPGINMIASRYLTISYGQTNLGAATQYAYCLIMDIQTGRMGRIKIDHVDTLDWIVDSAVIVLPAFPAPLEPTFRIGFIDLTGVVSRLDIALNSVNDVLPNTGLIVIGKFQLQRNNGVFHQRTKLECSYNGLFVVPTVACMPTLNGKDFLTPVNLLELTPASTSALHVFGGKVYGLNMSLLIQGPFNLSSLQSDFTLGGTDRNYG